MSSCSTSLHPTDSRHPQGPTTTPLSNPYKRASTTVNDSSRLIMDRYPCACPRTRISMPWRTAVVFILFALFPKRAAASVPGPPSSIYQDAVTNSTKAGLAWPNSNYDDISQFLGTGKVQWYVRSPLRLREGPFFSHREPSVKVLYLEPRTCSNKH